MDPPTHTLPLMTFRTSAGDLQELKIISPKSIVYHWWARGVEIRTATAPMKGQRLIASRNAILLQMHSHPNTVKFLIRNIFFLRVTNTIKILAFP